MDSTHFTKDEIDLEAFRARLRKMTDEESIRESEMGIHRERLAASRAHKRCIAGMKQAARSMGLQVPGPSDISPKIIGGQPLPFPVPPILEEALGYRGSLRFVGFGYNPKTRHFCFCDGGDDIPVHPGPWITFLHHPVVAPHLPQKRYPRLYGMFTGKDQPTSMPMLLLDRDKRKAYISRRDQLFVLFALVEMEEGSQQRVFVDGLLMSSGSKEYKVPPRPETLQKLREFLNESLRLNSSSSISSETSG